MTRAVYSDGSFDVKLDDGAALQRRTADEWEPLLILRYEEGHDQRVVSMDQLRFLRPQFLDAASLSPPGPAPPPPRAACDLLRVLADAGLGDPHFGEDG